MELQRAERREEERKGKKCSPQFLIEIKFSSHCQHLKWAHRVGYKLVIMVAIPGELTEKLIKNNINKVH